ncbi:serine-rich adhesin for platelets-like [Teleopsis dalmanni]|uniref:serine-rich adhesin for platelets-like n=1 Tax=Teleopsis dalmanni TaxID=139649 RepID=UPI0018CCB547|nr:serine-rich adhesin for platelets-like [Teleopsis dalmanni]
MSDKAHSESDLLTFAQRKTHYNSDKSHCKELFTAITRPRSVRVLYEDAAKVSSVSSAATSPRSKSFAMDGNANGVDGLVDITGTGATTAAGSDELVCTPVFGKAHRKMQTRIDAEIEIRLPAAIEELRKWTSTEALGDVTVTPDCMHHVDTSISTSVIIGDNGVLTPALSPSVLSADAVDALYSINVSNVVDNSQIPNDINKDVPLNHRLPSPEEQCKIIALRYPAEVISVDTSGKRFQRMCMARKSTTGVFTNLTDTNNLNDDVQTVSRRSRSRKVRGKRRNTIAGIDQKEIQDAANGDATATSGELKNTTNAGIVAATGTAAAAAVIDEDANSRRSEKSKKFGRSKSSDILKKESVALPYDKGKSTLTRLNSLKQWGRNRFKFMQRNESATLTLNASNNSSNGPDNGNSITQSSAANEKAELKTNCNNSSGSGSSGSSYKTSSHTADSGNIDDECVVHELISQKNEGRFSHERKPSYSSSEKSMSVSSSGHLRGKLHLATCGNVKLRDTSSLNRQRRNGITANGLCGKDEQPHSSSGNWSASSESGRASIGSEITIQPKSSASNTSLNVSSFHPGSGPPSSMLSRRRFLNTSASSSVTSEGTATPDLQVTDGTYPNHLDDETSSAYSCDTEGYYTSFHMDSGLRTLKEEETLITPIQSGHNLHTNNYSFGSQANQTVLSAENEYELFGRGSTSTTTSSAGTVCTTLMMNGEQSSLNGLGPDVPERISSLGKLNKSNHSNSASTSTLERSYSSSTIGSTLERTGTIKRNVNANLKISPIDGSDVTDKSTETPESQDDEFNFEQRIRKRTAQPLPAAIISEIECSESSDLEGVERIERIKQKTAINAKRIPSMCVITPTTSDDENQAKDNGFDPNKTLTNESSPCEKAAVKAEALLELKINEAEYSTVDELQADKTPQLTPTGVANKDYNLNVLKRSSNYGFNNMLEKLKVVLPNIKRSPSKSSSSSAHAVVDDDELYDTAGEYVTIADISNNNRRNQLQAPKSVGTSSLGIYYSNDIYRRKNSADSTNSVVTKGNEPDTPKRETEYVSLNELPYHLRKINSDSAATAAALSATYGTNNETHTSNMKFIDCAESKQQQQQLQQQQQQQWQRKQSESTNVVPMYAEISELTEKSSHSSPLAQHKGARVRVNAQGKIIYDSDSLKRRKGAHTTFAPGPYVKETESALNENAVESITATKSQQQQQQIGNSESANCIVPRSAATSAAKLLFLNGGIAANRKVANVRPIVSTSPLSQQTQRLQQQQQQQQQSFNMPITTYMDQQPQQQHEPLSYNSYQENKNLLANHTNPFFQSTMMPSPSTKSTSSTGSTISTSTNTSGSTASTASSSTSSSTAKEEGKQYLVDLLKIRNYDANINFNANNDPNLNVNNTFDIHKIIETKTENDTTTTHTNNKPTTPPTPIRTQKKSVRVTYSVQQGSEETTAMAMTVVGIKEKISSQNAHQNLKSTRVENHESATTTTTTAATASPLPIRQPHSAVNFKLQSPPPPPLPPRGRINVSAQAKTMALADAAPSAYAPLAESDNSARKGCVGSHGESGSNANCSCSCCNVEKSICTTVDPIVGTATNSICTAITTSPLSNSDMHVVTSAPKTSRPLKRNNSYRLANDDLKLEMNKENCLIYADSRDAAGGNTTLLPINSTFNSKTLPHVSTSLKVKNLINTHNHTNTSNGNNNNNANSSNSTTITSSIIDASTPKSTNQRMIAKSFERLVDEFSLSTTSMSMDSSYLRNKSLENFDDSPTLLNGTVDASTDSTSSTLNKTDKINADDSDSDSDLELTPQSSNAIGHKYHKSFVENVLLKPFKIILPNEDNGARRQKILQKFEVTEIW